MQSINHHQIYCNITKAYPGKNCSGLSKLLSNFSQLRADLLVIQGVKILPHLLQINAKQNLK